MPHQVSAQPTSGTIAYVRPNDQTGDEIWLIEPDGSNNRRIWSVGQPDPNNIVAISDLDWHPNASQLAFASNHEEVGDTACSLFDLDIYAIWLDGNGYRRITNAPACANLAAFPKGSVTVTVRNASTHNPLFVYIQGAPKVQSVLVSQGSSATVRFSDGISPSRCVPVHLDPGVDLLAVLRRDPPQREEHLDLCQYVLVELGVTLRHQRNADSPPRPRRTRSSTPLSHSHIPPTLDLHTALNTARCYWQVMGSPRCRPAHRCCSCRPGRPLR